MSHDITNITIAEGIIVESLSYNGNFLSRDEEGDLWVTENKPTIHKGVYGEYLGFEQVKGVDGMHSLSVFNHMFNYIGKLDIIKLEKDLLKQINESPGGPNTGTEKIVIDGNVESE